MTNHRKKLIEVALPLDDINAACVREKSIRHGHPCTLHPWWARRPLAAARAVIFAQMVDDPGSVPGLSEEEIVQERERLFDLIRELVKWENTNNEEVLERARAEIRKSWARTCEETGEDPDKLPAFHDPFAGGGALPLEAQRLGLESHASDLNPVAVLINKAMIEIPPKFAGEAPVNPEARKKCLLSIAKRWKGAQGLAEDVRYYGQWVRDEAEKRIGHLYPKLKITDDIVAERSDLEKYRGQELKVVAWLWARTVTCPNPGCACEMPLLTSLLLSSKKGKETYLEPVFGTEMTFNVVTKKPTGIPDVKHGYKRGLSGTFECWKCGTITTRDYVAEEAKRKGLGAIQTVTVCQAKGARVYLNVAFSPIPDNIPLVDEPDLNIELAPGPDISCRNFGLNTPSDLFTPRQLVALTTFSDLVDEVRERIQKDALAAGVLDDAKPLRDGGKGANAYGEAVGVYLALGVDKSAGQWSSICTWNSGRQNIRGTFARQAIPLAWDYAETNPLSDSSGNWMAMIDWMRKALAAMPATLHGFSRQSDSQHQIISDNKVISTDPPYYGNIRYADLSDFFYVWLRRTVQVSYPRLFATLAVSKVDELIAAPYRHGGKSGAEKFFLDGMTEAISRLAEQAKDGFPVTIYYAFKQSETKGDAGNSSTGWETFLTAVLTAGFGLTGTWPLRTERSNRLTDLGANALTSSIVLVCRKRPKETLAATRRTYIRTLRAELPNALKDLQKSNIAPVDLAQSSIGLGMAIFSKYKKVIEADGSAMSVRDALQLINQLLDESLGAEEGAFDPDTRFAVTWFETYQYAAGTFGEAHNLALSQNVSVKGVQAAGVLSLCAGKVRLLTRADLPEDWDPETDQRLTVWEATQHLIKRLEENGEQGAANLLKKLGGTLADQARNLAYHLYTTCERKKWAEEARAYNGLVVAWPDLEKLASSSTSTAAPTTQTSLFG